MIPLDVRARAWNLIVVFATLDTLFVIMVVLNLVGLTIAAYFVMRRK